MVPPYDSRFPRDLRPRTGCEATCPVVDHGLCTSCSSPEQCSKVSCPGPQFFHLISLSENVQEWCPNLMVLNWKTQQTYHLFKHTFSHIFSYLHRSQTSIYFGDSMGISPWQSTSFLARSWQSFWCGRASQQWLRSGLSWGAVDVVGPWSRLFIPGLTACDIIRNNRSVYLSIYLSVCLSIYLWYDIHIHIIYMYCQEISTVCIFIT